MDLLKNLNNMITAEELLANNIDGLKDIINDDDLFYFYKGVICEFAKGLAELHVIEALKEAFNNSEIRVSENDTNEHPSFTNNYDDGYVTITVSKNSILDAYPLENIK